VVAQGDVCACKRQLAACHRLGRRLETRFRQRELEAEDAEAAAAEQVATEAARREDTAKGQLSNILGRHAVFLESDPDIQFGSGAPASEDNPLISPGSVDLGAVRSARVRPDPAKALVCDELDDHARGACLVRQTPRPDRVLEALKVASVVDSVGRVPTGPGAPTSATSAILLSFYRNRVAGKTGHILEAVVLILTSV